MANTRRINRFHDVIDFGQYSHSWVSYRDAARFIDRVWYHEAADRLNPLLVPHNDSLAAYYHLEQHTISVEPLYRSRALILHELTHALGYEDHDDRFAARLVGLLASYARVPMGVLALGAGMAGMQVLW